MNVLVILLGMGSSCCNISLLVDEERECKKWHDLAVLKQLNLTISILLDSIKWVEKVTSHSVVPYMVSKVITIMGL